MLELNGIVKDECMNGRHLGSGYTTVCIEIIAARLKRPLPKNVNALMIESYGI